MSAVEFVDTLDAEHADGEDARLMAQGTHYNYVEQRWVDGHDHAHLVDWADGPLYFCGADRVTCAKGR